MWPTMIIMEYTLRTTNKPIGVATYSFYQTLPEDMRSLLPSPDEIAAIIREFDDSEESEENLDG